ncbi:mucolipin-3-like [Diadema antillarum]|uniref:mucolipin-3-like n=1 Tax=Diadema antillarum TaxID=105358 RepID=UPI003A847561
MRAARASSVNSSRDSERHNTARAGDHEKPRSSSQSHAHKHPDRGHTFRRQERVGSHDESGSTSAAIRAAPNSAGQHPGPEVLLVPPPIVYTTSFDFCTSGDDSCDPDMNTLAAQTVACTGGSSYSINAQTHCECDHNNRGNDHHHQNHNHCSQEEDVFRTSPANIRAVNEMRWELRYFFMNPYLKYKKRGRKPYKLGLQVLKIVLVTLQLILFGTSQFSLTQFYKGNHEAFEHLFLKNWDTAFDSLAYPQTASLYALYQQDEFYAHMNHVASQFANLKTMAIGTYVYDRLEGEQRKLHVWQENYKAVQVTDDGQFFINQTIHTDYIVISLAQNPNVSVKNYLAEHNQSLNFDTMRELRLNFMVSSVHLKDSGKAFSIPDCIKFNITITYDNTQHTGRVPVSLSVMHDFYHNCTINNTQEVEESQNPRAMMTYFLDILVISLCLLSAILCIRSIVKAQKLKRKTVKFFKEHFNAKLSRSERMEFLNLWYVLIIVNDICTIAGSAFKILIEVRNTNDYDSCSLLLGMGCFLVWFGVLRYLGFFNKYNILIVTLKNAMPNVVRFLICAGIIYSAYAFFGWIVLGPYHPKFRTLEISIECMFSLINGDDMYATFREMSDRNQVIYIFSRIYLYSFISLFIYVVLSLIIAVIMDTYETMKEYQRTGFVEGRLQNFMAETCDEAIPGRGSFHTQSSMFERWQLRHRLQGALCCCRRRSWYDEDDALIT